VFYTTAYVSIEALSLHAYKKAKRAPNTLSDAYLQAQDMKKSWPTQKDTG
jgi:hypothetical protein